MNTIAKPLNITDDSFDQVLKSTDKPVLVDFWASWCGPCQMMAPVLDELASDYDGRALITKLDVDANPTTAAKFGVRSIPTLLVFKNGEVVDQQVGAVPKEVLAQKIEATA